jgi:hypothetical protein
VKEYHPKSDKHTIWYRDGDAQTLCLRHEPVLWIDGDAPADEGAADGAPPTPPFAAVNGGGAAAVAAGAPPTATGGGKAGAAAANGGAQRLKAAGGGAPEARAGVSSGAGAGGGSEASDCEADGARALLEQAFPPTPAGVARLLGKHARSEDGVGGGGGKRRKHEPGRLVQPALSSAAGGGGGARVAAPVEHPGKPGLVGCRVSVFWRSDKRAYRVSGVAGAVGSSCSRGGRSASIAAATVEESCRALRRRTNVTSKPVQGTLTSFSPLSGKFTVKYDDGQTEQLLLEGERIHWHAPRGATAGYTPERHAVMAALGVEAVAPAPAPAPLPEAWPEGVAGPGSVARGGAPGADAAGWRLQLWFGGDGAWHEGEVRGMSCGGRCSKEWALLVGACLRLGPAAGVGG